MLYGSFVLAALGVAVLAAAPLVEVALLALVPIGMSAGAFLAVDWALMTDIIPKATTGRYMGISNVATATAGPLGLTVAGVVLAVVFQLAHAVDGTDFPLPSTDFVPAGIFDQSKLDHGGESEE